MHVTQEKKYIAKKKTLMPESFSKIENILFLHKVEGSKNIL